MATIRAPTASVTGTRLPWSQVRVLANMPKMTLIPRAVNPTTVPTTGQLWPRGDRS